MLGLPKESACDAGSIFDEVVAVVSEAFPRFNGGAFSYDAFTFDHLRGSVEILNDPFSSVNGHGRFAFVDDGNGVRKGKGVRGI